MVVMEVKKMAEIWMDVRRSGFLVSSDMSDEAEMTAAERTNLT